MSLWGQVVTGERLFVRESAVTIDKKLRLSGVLGAGGGDGGAGGDGGGALDLVAETASTSVFLTARMNGVSLPGEGERESAPVGRARSLSLRSGG